MLPVCVGSRIFRDSVIDHQYLIARRLIEGGCRFVTIHKSGRDMHGNINNPGIESEMEMLGCPLDKALSGFLSDFDEQGLRDRVLTILTGDFGRAPRINNAGGRDHWARFAPWPYSVVG